MTALLVLFATAAGFPSIELTTWAGIAAAAAIVGSCWRTLGMWLNRIADLVICRVVLKDEAARAVMSQVWMRGRRSPFGLRLFGGVTSFVFPKRRVEVVAFEGVTSEPLLFWMGRVPLIIANGFHRGQQTDPSVGSWNDNQPPVTVRYLRGTLDMDAFVAQAVQAYNELRQRQTEAAKAASGPRRFNVIRMHGPARAANGGGALAMAKGETPIGAGQDPDLLTKLQRNELRLLTWKPDELIERSTDSAPFANHPVAAEVLAQFDEIDTWIKREQWFRHRGIRWARGYLLHGPSGSGKSTIVRNVAMRHDLPLYSFDLSTYDNRSFADDWKQVLQNAPAVALLEDLDCVFHGRENVAAKDATRDHLTFDCLLNVLSGVGSSDGVLLFVTTNHVEKLDPALGIPVNDDSRSTRPGRIDRAIYIGPMEEPERRQLATVILGDWPELIEPTVAEGAGEMAAQFQDRCVRLAYQRFWGQAQHI